MAPWTPETPWEGPKKDTLLEWPTHVCRNPHCKSVGKSHPNCKCGPLGASNEYAKGGEVHFCSSASAHQPSCEYFMAEGGMVPSQSNPMNDPEMNDQPGLTLPHAVIEHGLAGVLDGHLGHVSSHFDREKNDRFLDEAKAMYAHIGAAPPVDGLQEQAPEGHGSELGRHLFAGEHEKAADALMGSPIAGRATKRSLDPIMQRLAQPILTKETSSEGLKSAIEYLHSSARGASSLDDQMKTLFDGKKHHRDEKETRQNREMLEKKLKELQEKPESLFEIGGKLGHYLPNHATELGALSTRAIDYLNSLKPKEIQESPLDEMAPVDPLAQDKYHRALDLANQPLTAIHELRDGTFTPGDVVTLQTIYPDLYKTLQQKVFDQVVDAKSNDKLIPYRERAGLSLILGDPIDSTLTPKSMQAIISSAKPQGPQLGPQGHKSNATAATQKTIEKVDSLYEDPLFKRQANSKA